jgi:hypothetical protein
MRSEYYKEWAEKNQDKLRANRQRWSEKNREKKLESQRKYREKNRELLKDKAKEYYSENKVECYERNKKIIYEKYYNDDLFRLKFNLRKLINNSIKRQGYTKKSKSFDILGCEFELFKQHIQKQFQPWMSWDNYGGTPKNKNEKWEIDHIIPVSSASNEEEIIKLNHYTNLQPLCSYENRWIKSNKITYE